MQNQLIYVCHFDIIWEDFAAVLGEIHKIGAGKQIVEIEWHGPAGGNPLLQIVFNEEQLTEFYKIYTGADPVVVIDEETTTPIASDYDEFLNLHTISYSIDAIKNHLKHELVHKVGLDGIPLKEMCEALGISDKFYELGRVQYEAMTNHLFTEE